MSARDFRASRFNAGDMMGEDVNPSAYIVNLADCMLVLAVGFLVALVARWNIDVGAPEIDASQMEAVDPQVSESIVQNGGSYYEEAGKVYRDPNTGVLYLVQEDGSGEQDGAQGQKADESRIRDARAAGAD